MGSILLGGVRFVAYANDHPPRHVHGFYAETEAVVDLLLAGNVDLARRKDAVLPANAKASDVKKILTRAAENFVALVELWEEMRGKA